VRRGVPAEKIFRATGWGWLIWAAAAVLVLIRAFLYDLQKIELKKMISTA